MAYRIKVSGIYNLDTINVLKTEQIAHFGVDLRPRSFNFLQHHVSMELIKKLEATDHLYLHFQDEASFVVQKFINDIEAMILRDQVKILKQNVHLEFSGQFNQAAWDEFKRPYWLKWVREYPLTALLDLPLCQGVILGQHYLQDLLARGDFYRLVEILLKKKSMDKEFKITLALDEQCYPSLIDNATSGVELMPWVQEVLLHCSADFINFTMGPQIEEHYRRPNYVMLKRIVHSSLQVFSVGE